MPSMSDEDFPIVPYQELDFDLVPTPKLVADLFWCGIECSECGSKPLPRTIDPHCPNCRFLQDTMLALPSNIRQADIDEGLDPDYDPPIEAVIEALYRMGKVVDENGKTVKKPRERDKL